MRLPSPLAALLAFSLLGVLGAALALRLPPVDLGLRLTQQAFDLGHHLALGSLALGVVLIGRKRPLWAHGPLLALLLAGLGLLILPDDVSVRAGKLNGKLGLSAKAWELLLSTAIPQIVALAYLGTAGVCALSRRLSAARPRFFGKLPPWIAALSALGALGLGGINHLFGARAYLGVHFFVTLSAGAGLAVALTFAPVPLWWRAGRRGQLLVGAFAALGILSLLMPPSPRVQAELLRSPGAVVAPLLARLRPMAQGVKPTLTAEEAPFYQSRKALPAVEPSATRLLPKDAAVVLITIDAIRADLLADDRYAGRFPNLTALKRRSIHFTQARTTAPQTVPALGALMTSRYFSQRRWTNSKYGKKLKLYLEKDHTLSFPAVLSRHEVTTFHARSVAGFFEKFGVMRGFKKEVNPGRAAKKLAGALISQLKQQSSGPLFMYTHFMEPHEPYDQGKKSGTDFERYLSEVEITDRVLGKLIEALESSSYNDKYALIVTSDHGEAFGEHGTQFHAQTVYEELLRVPLFIYISGVTPISINEPVTHIDIAPTILDLFNISTPGVFQGQSLVGLMTGQTRTLTRPLIIDSGRRMQALLLPGGKKLIRDLRQGSVEFYDLNADPGELDNRFDTNDRAHLEHLGRLELFFEAHQLNEPGYSPPYRP